MHMHSSYGPKNPLHLNNYSWQRNFTSKRFLWNLENQASYKGRSIFAYGFSNLHKVQIRVGGWF